MTIAITGRDKLIRNNRMTSKVDSGGLHQSFGGVLHAFVHRECLHRSGRANLPQPPPTHVATFCGVHTSSPVYVGSPGLPFPSLMSFRKYIDL